MCRTSLGDDDVPRDTTYCDAVWIQQLTVVLATRTEVELEDSITVKHLNINQAINN